MLKNVLMRRVLVLSVANWTFAALAAFAGSVTWADRTKTIDDRYPEVRPTRAEIRGHQERGLVVRVRGVKSREAADYYRSLGVERFVDADPALWSRPSNSIDRAIAEVRRLDEAAEAKWTSFGSLREAEEHARQLRRVMTDAIGGFPERTPLNVRTTGSFARPGCRVEKVVFESQPRHHVTAYLLLPDAVAFKPPYRAVLIPLGHAAVGKSYQPYFKAGVVAARAGLAALVYDPVDQGERLQSGDVRKGVVTGHVNAGLRAELVGWSFARFRIWDAMRALDFLESRADIRSDGFGVMGQSGGGTVTAYLSALDPRVRVSCPAGFVTTTRDLTAFWGPQDCEQNLPGAMRLGLNHLSLMLMAAPNPVRLILAEDDAFPICGSLDTLAGMRRFYGRHGLGADRVDCDIARGKMHGWYDCSREASVRWIRRWLTGVDTPAPHLADEEALPPVAGSEDATVVPGGSVMGVPGERSVYDLIRLRADELRSHRVPLTREAVARISGIDVARAKDDRENVDCVRNGYWSYAHTPTDELACLYGLLGTSLVRVRAEGMIARAKAYAAANGGKRMKLSAKGHAAVAAAHAHYLAPELFDGLEIADPPSSWRTAIDDPSLPLSPQDVLFGAFAAYDWTDLLD